MELVCKHRTEVFALQLSSGYQPCFPEPFLALLLFGKRLCPTIHVSESKEPLCINQLVNKFAYKFHPGIS